MGHRGVGATLGSDLVRGLREAIQWGVAATSRDHKARGVPSSTAATRALAVSALHHHSLPLPLRRWRRGLRTIGTSESEKESLSPKPGGGELPWKGGASGLRPAGLAPADGDLPKKGAASGLRPGDRDAKAWSPPASSSSSTSFAQDRREEEPCSMEQIWGGADMGEGGEKVGWGGMSGPVWTAAWGRGHRSLSGRRREGCGHGGWSGHRQRRRGERSSGA